MVTYARRDCNLYVDRAHRAISGIHRTGTSYLLFGYLTYILHPSLYRSCALRALGDFP
jgi:hypothetical protein